MSSRHPKNHSSTGRVLTAARSLPTHRKLFGAGVLSVAVLGSFGVITPAAQASDGSVATHTSTYVGRTVRGVTSLSHTDAWAVGLTQQAGFVDQTLTEHWDGQAWVEVLSPNPAGEQVSDLLAVDAVSTDDVWAVGNSGVAETSHTIIEHWDGQQWTLMPDSRTGELYAVQAISADNVWAVGNYYDDSSVSRTMVMHWDGTAWSTVDSPDLPGHLYSVSAISQNDIWVDGFEHVGDVNQMLVEHWDGTSWTVVKTPTPGFYSELYGITAFSPDDVWAVGNFARTGKPQRSIMMHWNGAKWTMNTSTMGRTGPYLFGMSAVSSSKIWAVGRGTSKTLTARFNSTRWHEVDSPSPDNNTGEFFGVDARTGNDVWAVGRTQQLGHRAPKPASSNTGTATPGPSSPAHESRDGLEPPPSSRHLQVSPRNARGAVDQFGGALCACLRRSAND